MNFGIARESGGASNLRMDGINPAKKCVERVPEYARCFFYLGICFDFRVKGQSIQSPAKSSPGSTPTGGRLVIRQSAPPLLVCAPTYEHGKHKT